MAYTVEKLPGEPILVNILHSGFNFNSKMQTNARDEVIQILNNANDAARGSSPLLHHPNIRRTLIVSNDIMVALASKGMDSPIYGNVSMLLFPSMDEALDYARSQA